MAACASQLGKCLKQVGLKGKTATAIGRLITEINANLHEPDFKRTRQSGHHCAKGARRIKSAIEAIAASVRLQAEGK